MKHLGFLLGALLSFHALAEPVIPQNQNLAAVDYSREGKQTGCGLRATAETGDNLWLNILLGIYFQESGELLGMFKVAVKKINTRDGEPLLQDGKLIYSNIGKIRNVWIKTDSGARITPNEAGKSPHDDAYLTTLEFHDTMGLLAAMSHENFRIGFSIGANGSEEIFEFNQRITSDEADKLSACMKNLIGTIQENRSEKSF